MFVFLVAIIHRFADSITKGPPVEADSASIVDTSTLEGMFRIMPALFISF